MISFLESVEELSTSVLCECDIIVLAIHTILSTSNFVPCQTKEEIIKKTNSGNYAEMKFLRYEEPFFIRLVQNYDNIVIMASYNDIFSTLTLDPSSFVLKERKKSYDLLVSVKEWSFKFNSFSSRFRNVILLRLLRENPENTHFSSLTTSMKLHILSFLKANELARMSINHEMLELSSFNLLWIGLLNRDFSCKLYDISDIEDSFDAKTIYQRNQRKGQQRNASASLFYFTLNEQIGEQHVSPLLDLSPFAPPQNMRLPRGFFGHI